MTEKLGKTLQLLLVLAVMFGSHYFMPIQTIIEPPYTYFGMLLILVGVGLDVWAATFFKKAETSFKLRGKNTSLVTDGPFGFSRNPIYLGILAVLLGMAIFFGTLISFLYPVLFFISFQFIIIPMEEKRMEEIFGEKYLDYKHNTRRWI